MANVPPLSLSDIVDISVTVAPSAVTANSFNQGLIVGPSTVIPSYGAEPRLRQYGAGATAALNGMLADGFTLASPEYIAMQIYFSQTPTASYGWVGCQDLTAISTAIPHAGSAGTNYEVGDAVGVVQTSASNGFLTVLTVTTGGVVATLGITVGAQGTGYSMATALTTTGGSGTGLEVDITAIGETLLQASQACRAANSTWYGLMVCGPTDADNLAISEWADPLWASTRYYPWSSDTTIPAGTTGNLALQVQALKLRVIGTYSTTQSGLYPNNIYAAAAAMGVEMGLNTGLANSFFTIAHKQLAGIAPEPLSQTQYNNIKAAGFNAYCNFAPYQLYEPGFMSNGAPSYLWLNLAMLAANLQINELNVLQSNVAVPQTNAGEHLQIQAANSACDTMVNIGFLSGAVWEGAPVLNLATGQALPSGYLNQAAPYAQQLAGDRAAGKAMPIYCAVTTSGAVQSLLIGVYTQL
jgi:hypothetical protein